jgi:hypothetical protein
MIKHYAKSQWDQQLKSGGSIIYVVEHDYVFLIRKWA